MVVSCWGNIFKLEENRYFKISCVSLNLESETPIIKILAASLSNH